MEIFGRRESPETHHNRNLHRIFSLSLSRPYLLFNNNFSVCFFFISIFIWVLVLFFAGCWATGAFSKSETRLTKFLFGNGTWQRLEKKKKNSNETRPKTNEDQSERSVNRIKSVLLLQLVKYRIGRPRRPQRPNHSKFEWRTGRRTETWFKDFKKPKTKKKKKQTKTCHNGKEINNDKLRIKKQNGDEMVKNRTWKMTALSLLRLIIIRLGHFRLAIANEVKSI